ncbi:MAG: glycosyltransferase, partial [Muribaculaceae bacterium]|nr:glycosyltransferase [Muribaculaceae bacterium]
ITVLMSIYNGERFLREQIDSIIAQQDVNFKLIIRDDGSSDSSLSILEKYSQNTDLSDKIHIIKGENIGWKKSFSYLVDFAYKNCSSSQYFAFADQDDIWKPEKLKRAISFLNEHTDIPALYYSNLSFYQDGIDKGLIDHASTTPTFKNCHARNYATGCTIVFNKNLLLLLAMKRPDFVIPHDQWAYMVAALTGKVFPDNKSFILYRQHELNQIGSRHGFLDVWKRRFRNFSDNAGFRERTAKELIRTYSNRMHPEALEATKKIAYYRKSIMSRFHLLFDSGYTLGNPGNDFFFKLRILMGNL